MGKNINTGNPWKGLSSYTYQDAERFYGRDHELKDIVSIIKQNAFTTLYGISGAGKTSIINAGLFPLLDKQSFLPIYIRLDHNVGHVPYDTQIIKAVDNALLSIEAESENIIGNDIDSELDKLWLYFHSHRFWSKDNHIINPIIFIDQFEEIFTKNEEADNIWSFFNTIDSLQYSTPTERILNAMENADNFVSFSEEQNFRIVFSMREDFLARLEDYSYNIPALRKNRIGLKPLNGLQALEVILKPRPEMVTRKVALHIISKVVGKTITDNERKLEATSVDTSILSLFCTELYNYAMSDNKGEISIPLVDLYGGNILEWFYDRNMQILPKQTYVYLENQLLTHSGFRNSVALENLLENGVLQEQLDLLAENRIIRIEDVNHNLRVEFTHDVLCKIAKKRKDERDAIEKMKGEQAARRAFTIDNVILFSAFILALLAIYYTGINKSILISLVSLPFISFLYMIIANRTVADKNLSKIIWFIIICLFAEGLLFTGTYNLEDTLTSKFSSNLLVSSVVSCMSILPLAIVLMPFALLLKHELKERIHILKSLKQSAIVYVIFLLVQSLLLFLWIYYTAVTNIPDISDHVQYLPFFLFPTILLTLSPTYFLWKNAKQKTSKTLSGCTFAYTLYIVFVSLIIWGESEYRILPSTTSDANLIALAVIWWIIGVLCTFYAIQYMKLPTRQNFTEYYINIFSFQAFTKYKSFRSRLYTILICFAIFMMGVIATYYKDIVPFFTLPIACILALHVGCSEIKLTKPKNAFSYKCIIPIIFLTEIIVGCQYIIGAVKMPVIYISATLIAALVFYYLINNELLRNRKLFTIRVFTFAVFIGFALPLICIGYNIFNSSLSSVSRVWNGAISSNARNIYFMTIEDADGNVGAMDYSEIIVEPKYQRIASDCSIDEDIVKAVYRLRYLLMDIFNIRYIGNDYSYYEKMNNNYGCILSFNVDTYDETKKELSRSYFLDFKNKYGKAYVDNLLSTSSYSKEEISWILSSSNKCISDKGRNAAIVRLFLKEMANLTPGVYKNLFEYGELGEKSIRLNDYDNDYEKLLKKCYNEASLKSLLRSSDSLSRELIYRTVINSSYIFKTNSAGELKHLILDELWDKLDSDSTKQVSYADKSLLLLISGNKDEAEMFAVTCMNKSSNDINSLINYLIVLYCNGKTDLMQSTLRNYKTRKQDPSHEMVLANKLANIILDLKMCGILIETDEERIVNYFKDNGLLFGEDYQSLFGVTIYIDAFSTKTYSFTFTTTNIVRVMVEGDGSTNVDVYIYDTSENEIATDLTSTDKCSCVFTPQEGAEYYVKILNLGPIPNLCKIRVE